MRWLAISSLALFGGCGSLTVVKLHGEVFLAHKLHTVATDPALPNATIDIYDEGGVAYGSTTADGGGLFKVNAPGGQTIFAVVSADGDVPASFSGTSGLNPKLKVEDGALYGVPAADLDAERALFAGCPSADAGPAIYGEVRVYGLQDPFNNGEEPLVTTATVTASSSQNVLFDACYLDDAGDAYDATSTETGQSGKFAIFGVTPGTYRVSTVFTAYGTTEYPASVSAFVPDDPAHVDDPENGNGVVPELPVWVDFPY